MKKLIFFTFLTICGPLCFFLYGLIGSHVDEQGVLHEPFALIPLGYLCMAIGLIGTLITSLMLWRERKATS